MRTRLNWSALLRLLSRLGPARSHALRAPGRRALRLSQLLPPHLPAVARRRDARLRARGRRPGDEGASGAAAAHSPPAATPLRGSASRRARPRARGGAAARRGRAAPLVPAPARRRPLLPPDRRPSRVFQEQRGATAPPAAPA